MSTTASPEGPMLREFSPRPYIAYFWAGHTPAIEALDSMGLDLRIPIWNCYWSIDIGIDFGLTRDSAINSLQGAMTFSLVAERLAIDMTARKAWAFSPDHALDWTTMKSSYWPSMDKQVVVWRDLAEQRLSHASELMFTRDAQQKGNDFPWKSLKS